MATIVFNSEQQHALLGHFLTNKAVFDAALYLDIHKLEAVASDISKGIFDDPNDNRVFRCASEFAAEHKRMPTLQELRFSSRLPKETGQELERSYKALDRALSASETMAVETILPTLINLKLDHYLTVGVTDIIKNTYNAKKDIPGAVAQLEALAAKLARISETGLSAMTKTSADWVDVSIARQKGMAGRLIYTGIPFIDEPILGLKPDDLMVVASYTGWGKSQLVTLMAMKMAAAGKKVHVFALEAYEAEIETRLRFAKAADKYWSVHHEDPNYEAPDYPAWTRGLLDLSKYEPSVKELKQLLTNITVTYKKSSKYTVEQLEKDVLRIKPQDVDIILIDHLHYIDKGSNKNETEALSETVRRIRDLNLAIDRPIVLAAHVKKSQEQRRYRTLLPDMNDIYGSGDISKTATIVLALAQTQHLDSASFPYDALKKKHPIGFPTVVRILKGREVGANRSSVTIVPFFRRGDYDHRYTLGRTEKADTVWQPMEKANFPAWAKSAFEYKP